VVHAPVDSLRANPFGLLTCTAMCGSGAPTASSTTRVRRERGTVSDLDVPAPQMGRGGAFTMTAGIARVTNRGPGPATHRDETIGCDRLARCRAELPGERHAVGHVEGRRRLQKPIGLLRNHSW
jgi:hypothetical protein